MKREEFAIVQIIRAAARVASSMFESKAMPMPGVVVDEGHFEVQYTREQLDKVAAIIIKEDPGTVSLNQIENLRDFCSMILGEL